MILRDTAVDRLNALEALPQEETLTQLYFTDHAALDKTVKVGSTQDVAFTLRNIESQPVDYAYVMASQASKGKMMLAEDTVRLAPGEVKDITKSIDFPKDTGRTLITITVTYQLPSDTYPKIQTIHYWVTITSSTASSEEKA